MKTLQNNFTTPEQSKRLLELGVPADSADMWWEKDETILINGEWVHGADWGKIPSLFNFDRENSRYYTYSEIKAAVDDFIGNETLPCWSVGRLMEILIICDTYPGRDEFMFDKNSIKPSLIDNIISKIEELEGFDMLDLSKLEE